MHKEPPMELKQYNIEPTDENVLASLREDITGRNAFLAPFLEIIDLSFVSTLALNGNWGSGKTFFIKQAMMLLQWADADSGLDAGFRGELDLLIKNEQSGLTASTLSGPYRTVYYNAWLYDDHNDPIQSLLYFLSVTFGRQYGVRSPKAAELFSGAVQTLARWKGLDLDALADSLRSDDPLNEVKELESVKFSLQEAFHDLLGDTYSLVIFVDELDRCSPAYAVRFLERIKHFFDCPKVKFVFATNLRQLGATIQNFYGANFDSTKYLNKFFDLPVELPPVSPGTYLMRQGFLQDSHVFQELCTYLIRYFDFSIRDINIFLSMAGKIESRVIGLLNKYWNWKGAYAFSYLFFPPVLAALSLDDRAAYNQIIIGQGESLISDIFTGWPEGQAFMNQLFSPAENTSSMQELVLYEYRGIFGSGRVRDDVDPQGTLKTMILNIVSKLY